MTKQDVINMLKSLGKYYEQIEEDELDYQSDKYNSLIITTIGIQFAFMDDNLVDLWSMD